MTKIIIISSLVFFLISCSTGSQKTRSITNTNEDNTNYPEDFHQQYVIDPKFESFEQGSFEHEKAINDQLIDASKTMMSNMHRESRVTDLSNQPMMTRDAHAKSHGCLKAKFIVDNSNLPPENQKGIFKENREYDAWVRFSNNDHLPLRKDGEPDLRGMSIKVMGVDGEKIMEGYENAPTQDFLLYGSKVFFIKDNEDYIDFIEGLRDEKSSLGLFADSPTALAKTRIAQNRNFKYINVLDIPFFSAIPIRLGHRQDPERTAVKYSATPCGHRYTLHHDYLRKNLAISLDPTSSRCFDFKIQKFIDSKYTPIEDATHLWPDRENPAFNPRTRRRDVFSEYIDVAKIMIPRQNFNTKERDEYCENLSFTPWHALIEHRPLGRTMRMRRDIYRATADFRRRANRAKLEEPSGFDIE